MRLLLAGIGRAGTVRIMNRNWARLILAGMLLPSVLGADLVGRITLKGEAPPAATITLDKPCATAAGTNSVQIPDYAVGASNGLAEVVVYIKETPPGFAAKTEPVVIDQKGCLYVPHIAVAQVNQPVFVRNSDAMMHSVNIHPRQPGNRGAGLIQYVKADDLKFKYPAPESFIPFKSDFQPWMTAYLSVVESPCFTISEKDGRYKIPELPDGTYTLVAHHRLGGSQEKSVRISGRNSTNNFVFEVR
jgi:hypothetical protein